MRALALVAHPRAAKTLPSNDLKKLHRGKATLQNAPHTVEELRAASRSKKMRALALVPQPAPLNWKICFVSPGEAYNVDDSKGWHMCFSAAANFTGSGVLATAGVATLTKVKHKRELLFASLPTLFAIHQFIEGFVWLGLDGILSPKITHNMGAAFMLYAQGLLPFLLPLSVLLFEPDAQSRRRMVPFLVLGGATALYILWALTAFPLQLYIRQNSIVYINQATNHSAVAVLYVIATCGSLFFSKIRMMVIFGAANLAILLVVMVVKRYAFTSVWCAYAAVASVIILAYFWRTHKDRPFVYA